tara:strand:+ start:2468 stop:3685 length:1218 start_codon:yes stop_codon:yes gene_type:complete
MPQKRTVADFIEKSKLKFGDKFSYELLPNEFKKGDNDITLICLNHNNTFTCKIRSHLYDSTHGGCKICANDNCYRPSQIKLETESENNKEILVSPVHDICSCTIWNRPAKDGSINKKIGYYTKFAQHSKTYKNPTDNELETLKKEYNAKCVKFTDIFSVKVSELTPYIIKNYRFVQPKIEYEYRDIPIEPYILGVWLGDGTTKSVEITNIDKVIIDEWVNYANSIGLSINKYDVHDRKTDCKSWETPFVARYYITTTNSKKTRLQNIARQQFKNLKLLGNKHIPEIYLKNTCDIRLQVLAGLIDTDGHLDRCAYEITQKSETLSKNIYSLAQSLGFNTQIKTVKKSCMVKGNKVENVYYKVNIGGNQHTPIIPVRCERKKLNMTSKCMITNPRIDIHGNIVERKR